MRRLEFGDTLAGLLIDGVPSTPYVGATLRFSDRRGVAVEVPYLPHRDEGQFSHVQTWFDSQTPPSNMYMLTPEGTVCLFDIQWGGHSENWGGTRAAIGSVRPNLTVLGNRDGPVSDPLVVSEMHSRLDGLNEWSRLSAVENESETDNEGLVQSVTVRLNQDQGLTWQQGEATMSIRAGWTHAPTQDGYERSTLIANNAYIESTYSSGPVSFWDHFVEQRKVGNLMVLLFGQPISFREHRIRDSKFATRMMDGRIANYPLTEVISSNTYRERRVPAPSKKELGRPIAHLSQIGTSGLMCWHENYEKWERFILPSAAILGQRDQYVENIVTSTSTSIEAAGAIIGERPGEEATKKTRPSTATYVYRCLDLLNIKWPARINNKLGLARAIANNYNEVKHYDRGELPSHEETHLIKEINELIVRLLSVYLTGMSDELLKGYREGEYLYHLKQILDAYELNLDEKGTWHKDGDAKTA